ncbi:DUF5986 family protein [Brachyspira hyodysenteriae]|uniref:DUF5986 family protein n=1 Tax=Brachyspira hyodysenteriae TaxID=159 RepID=UPI00063DA91B|nr:DUF5986 family protein [Brachyspira hyodysenteriae]KLI16510.1 hypothetical protein SU45_07240 [Brachyspira hyodysenteriae]KLI59507.1 hypothetical protein SZ46_08620 [Brachyspira hyodysenteriae]
MKKEYDNILKVLKNNQQPLVSELLRDAIDYLQKHSETELAHNELLEKFNVYIPFLFWSKLNTNLTLKCNKTFYIPISSWKTVFIYDEETETIISFMKHNRFYKLQTNENTIIPIYQQALAMINDTGKEQYEFDFYENEYNNKIIEKNNEIITKLNNVKIENHVLIVFGMKRYKSLNFLSAYVLNSNFSIIASDNWFDNINIDVPINNYNDPKNPPKNPNNTEPLVHINPKYSKNDDEGSNK